MLIFDRIFEIRNYHDYMLCSSAQHAHLGCSTPTILETFFRCLSLYSVTLVKFWMKLFVQSMGVDCSLSVEWKQSYTSLCQLSVFSTEQDYVALLKTQVKLFRVLWQLWVHCKIYGKYYWVHILQKAHLSDRARV